MLDFKFQKADAYLAACTYGADSMALVSMLEKEGVKPIVLFLDYRAIENSDEIKENLRKYCEEHELIFEYKDIKEQRPDEAHYKEWARKARYEFFHEMYEKYILPELGREAVCLPSTSPANAQWSLEKLTAAWSVLKE